MSLQVALEVGRTLSRTIASHSKASTAFLIDLKISLVENADALDASVTGKLSSFRMPTSRNHFPS